MRQEVPRSPRKRGFNLFSTVARRRLESTGLALNSLRLVPLNSAPVRACPCLHERVWQRLTRAHMWGWAISGW